MVRHEGRLRPGVILASVNLGCLLLASASGSASAQDADYFSPTYAASEGSPYSEVYARIFGVGGAPLQTSAPATEPANAEFPRLGVPPVSPQTSEPVMVYVIEGGRLLTYNASDYAVGGEALQRSPLPSAGSGLPPEVRVPTIADRLYETPALETAADMQPQGTPVPRPRRKPAD